MIFGVGQSRTATDRQWLFDLARNEKNPLENRKQAIFWLGQSKDPRALEWFGRGTQRDDARAQPRRRLVFRPLP